MGAKTLKKLSFNSISTATSLADRHTMDRRSRSLSQLNILQTGGQGGSSGGTGSSAGRTGLLWSKGDSHEWHAPVLGQRSGGGGGRIGIGGVREGGRVGERGGLTLSLACKKTLTAPRPEKTVQMFVNVKRALREYIDETRDLIGRLGSLHCSPTNTSPVAQLRFFEAEKQIKIAERYIKRLEFHLTKIEELEDNYRLYEQLSEGLKLYIDGHFAAVVMEHDGYAVQGAKTMTKAYLSYCGANRKTSLQSVQSGYKECTRTLCQIESALENSLGSFHCTMNGTDYYTQFTNSISSLVGFARLVPGDVFDVSLKYGSQRWKCRCKIGHNGQTCEPGNMVLKVLIAESILIKVLEVKTLGKNVYLGEKCCDTKYLLSARPRTMTISLNPSGSIKLSLLVRWNPLDGSEDGSTLSFNFPSNNLLSPPLSLPLSPSPDQLELDYTTTTTTLLLPNRMRDKSSTHTPPRMFRYSMPLIPPSFSPSSPDFVPSFLSQSPLTGSPVPSLSSDEVLLQRSRSPKSSEDDDEDDGQPVCLAGFISRRGCYSGNQASSSPHGSHIHVSQNMAAQGNHIIHPSQNRSKSMASIEEYSTGAVTEEDDKKNCRKVELMESGASSLKLSTEQSSEDFACSPNEESVCDCNVAQNEILPDKIMEQIVHDFFSPSHGEGAEGAGNSSVDLNRTTYGGFSHICNGRTIEDPGRANKDPDWANKDFGRVNEVESQLKSNINQKLDNDQNVSDISSETCNDPVPLETDKNQSSCKVYCTHNLSVGSAGSVSIGMYFDGEDSGRVIRETESLCVEDALEAFNFLDSEDCLGIPHDNCDDYLVTLGDEEFIADSPKSIVGTDTSLGAASLSHSTDSGVDSLNSVPAQF